MNTSNTEELTMMTMFTEDLELLNSTCYFLEGNSVFVVDVVTDDRVDTPYYLNVVESFHVVYAYEENQGDRRANTFYIWYKEAQNTYKGEITVSGLLGWEDVCCFVAFGDTQKECLENLMSKFTSSNNVVELV
jgi:hypothetical protein